MTTRRTARVRTGALDGIDGIAVTAEIDISRGLPGFHLVGLPNAEVRESRERVLSALRNSGQKTPLGRITVNLAPAGVRKSGAAGDLAVALGVLAAGKAIRLGPAGRTGAAFVGELSLFGDVRPVRGLLAMVMELAAAACPAVVVPADQIAEAGLVEGIEIVGVKTLAQAIGWWEGGRAPALRSTPVAAAAATPADTELWSDLAGQPSVRKGAVVAAAGGHHCLLVGPPGSGKTRLARGLGRWHPPLETAHALEVTRIHSAVGAGPVQGLVSRRPFRCPHHSISRAGLVGGGAGLRPGEVTLAHRGILFLDEVSEYAPSVLDGLREPLEDGRVTLIRGAGVRDYPAVFQLVAAMNPCRCGFLGSGQQACRCSAAEVQRHRGRLSGPLLDRIDLFIEVGGWEGAFLATDARPDQAPPRGDRDWRERPRYADLLDARRRLATAAQTPLRRRLTPAAAALLDDVRRPLGLSLRGVTRCMAVAATFAALDGTGPIDTRHVRESLEYRLEFAAA